ncbi:MAG: type IV toxin-antitoxin system AbiEi family antitoxin domain-containing protein [Nocardioides sp.]
MPTEAVSRLLSDQAGVVSRAQLGRAGAQPHDIARWRRRRELVVVHPGVYVDHTGDLSWLQRAWAAVLACEPAALWRESALRAHEGPGRPGSEDGPVHVAVDRSRHLSAPEGVRVHRRVRLDERSLWSLAPPRQRYDDAALEVALDRADPLDAIEVVARAVQHRRTTAQRLADSLAERPRAQHRDWLDGVLRDIASGTCSVLEYGYLTLVERPHGLPTALRQPAATASVGLIYRDNEYGTGLVVELDGRLFHDSAGQRDADFERDLDTAVDGQDTRRLSYGQVYDRPCSTAGKIARLLVLGGWRGRLLPCGPRCPALRVFAGDRIA